MTLSFPGNTGFNIGLSRCASPFSINTRGWQERYTAVCSILVSHPVKMVPHRFNIANRSLQAILVDQWIYIDGGEVILEKGINFPSMF